MALRLTAEQLSQALAGLSLTDRQQLLSLLQERERLEAEKPIDNRPSLESFVDEDRDQAAAASSDPAAYVVAWDAHLDALLRISARRAKVTVPAWGQCPSSEALAAEFREVVELARAEGCAPPWEVVKPPEPEAPPPDSLEVMKRKSLPRATQRDLQDSAVHTAEERVYASIRTEQRAAASEPEDKLRWFRDQAAPGVPPAWPDS